MEARYAPFSRPLYVMAKAAGSACNMRCKYCYYLEKGDLYATDGNPRSMNMPDDVLEEYIRQYIESQTTPQVMFTWHGGESMLRPVSFYEKVISIQQRYARSGIQIDNSIQTNGTLITDEWARFLADNHWLVGVSIDGPAAEHDLYRHMTNGRGSHADVMRGIEILNRHGVEWNAMAVVNDHNSHDPRGFYNFFKSIGCNFIQFTPIVERIRPDGHLATPRDVDAVMAPWAVKPEVWGEFLCGVFDEWIGSRDIGKVFVQIFDSTLAGWMGVDPGVCTMSRSCGHAGILEHNGDLYSCDHFVFPEYKLGNIKTSTIFEMMSSRRQIKFGQSKVNDLPRRCRQCRWLSLCNGECPKNRVGTPTPGLNYLCEGYRRYFKHTAPAMQAMAAALRAGRPAWSILDPA